MSIVNACSELRATAPVSKQIKRKIVTKCNKNSRNYKSFLKTELREKFSVTKSSMKKIFKIIKKDKEMPKLDNFKNKISKARPSFKKDKQYIILPAWLNMEDPVHVEMAKGLTLDEILKDCFYEPGQVPEEEELEWFTEANVRLINKNTFNNPKEK